MLGSGDEACTFVAPCSNHDNHYYGGEPEKIKRKPEIQSLKAYNRYCPEPRRDLVPSRVCGDHLFAAACTLASQARSVILLAPRPPAWFRVPPTLRQYTFVGHHGTLAAEKQFRDARASCSQRISRLPSSSPSDTTPRLDPVSLPAIR